MRAPSSELPIEFDAVTLTAGGVTILDDVSLSFAAGPPTVLIGPNGSGKSTLLRLAMGLLAPLRGRITWGGLEGVPPHKRAIVFQRPAMLRRSAGANIRFALRAAGIPRAEVVGRNVLRNALITPITVLGLRIGYLMGGAVVIEV